MGHLHLPVPSADIHCLGNAWISVCEACVKCRERKRGQRALAGGHAEQEGQDRGLQWRPERADSRPCIIQAHPTPCCVLASQGLSNFQNFPRFNSKTNADWNWNGVLFFTCQIGNDKNDWYFIILAEVWRTRTCTLLVGAKKVFRRIFL